MSLELLRFKDSFNILLLISIEVALFLNWSCIAELMILNRLWEWLHPFCSWSIKLIDLGIFIVSSLCYILAFFKRFYFKDMTELCINLTNDSNYFLNLKFPIFYAKRSIDYCLQKALCKVFTFNKLSPKLQK